MLHSSEWRAKAAEYAIKAHEIVDADLRQQYVELAVRYLDIAKKHEDVGIPAVTSAERPYATNQDPIAE